MGNVTGSCRRKRSFISMFIHLKVFEALTMNEIIGKEKLVVVPFIYEGVYLLGPFVCPAPFINLKSAVVPRNLFQSAVQSCS